ncbi:MAG: hypothetical protein J0H68_02485 [Sphingobacteriia bacterium]|nr:hypothetical protein [Sphingobacteriia bacterium]
MMQYFLLGLAIVVNLLGNVFAKLGADFKGGGKLGALGNPYLILCLCCAAISLYFFTKSLEKLPLHIAQPVLAIVSIVGVAFTSTIFFKAHMTPMQIAGILTAVVSIFLITAPA